MPEESYLEKVAHREVPDSERITKSVPVTLHKPEALEVDSQFIFVHMGGDAARKLYAHLTTDEDKQLLDDACLYAYSNGEDSQYETDHS